MRVRGLRDRPIVRTGTVALALAAAGPALAQDAARMDSIERQIRVLQSELSRLRREAAARDAKARTAREDAARARAEAREAQRRLDATPLAHWNIVNVDRLNAAGTTQIGQRFHTIGLRSRLSF